VFERTTISKEESGNINFLNIDIDVLLVLFSNNIPNIQKKLSRQKILNIFENVGGIILKQDTWRPTNEQTKLISIV